MDKHHDLSDKDNLYNNLKHINIASDMIFYIYTRLKGYVNRKTNVSQEIYGNCIAPRKIL